MEKTQLDTRFVFFLKVLKNKERTHKKYWALRAFPNLFIILICVPRVPKWFVPRVFNEDLVRSPQISTVRYIYIYIYIYIYTGSAKKMYTHFNERKLYVV